jgi:hypothetical protein
VTEPSTGPLPGGAPLGAAGEQAGQAAPQLAAPERPEVAVGLAFAGGLLTAILLKRLGS